MKAKNKIHFLAIFIILLPQGCNNYAVTGKSSFFSLADPSTFSQYQKMITPEALSKHLYIIASDSLGGRGTGEPGQKMAGQYLAAQYQAMGLVPKGILQKNNATPLDDYFQPFELYNAVPKKTTLEVMINGVKKMSSTFSQDQSDDLSYYLSGGATDATANVVFAGYGIADDTLNYNDFSALAAKAISVKDKWVLILANEPSSEPGSSLLNKKDHKPSGWSRSFFNKRIALWEAGQPKGILIIRDAEPRKTSFKEDAAAASDHLKYDQSLFIDELSADYPQAYAVSTKMADQILSAAGRTVKDLKAEIDQYLKPVVFDLNGVTIQSIVQKKPMVKTENVLAFLEGTDPALKKEIIVLSAHYDHLGIDPTLKGDQVFNGAADDGSGTVALLELAKAFKKATDEGRGPRRSILFASFSGEERGHLGSLYFTNRQPLVPLGKIVADINMDGVGGIDPKHPTQSKNYIYIDGEKEFSQELRTINKKINIATGTKVELTDAPPGFSSDHESFRDFHIPFIYYSTGLTEHYHQVTDAPNTIDYEHMAGVVQLIFGVTWQVANQDISVRTSKTSLKQSGYGCRPCNLKCDSVIFDRKGSCPLCGMTLVPKFSEK